MMLFPRSSLISIALGAALPLLLAHPAHPANAVRGYKSRACGLDMNHNGKIGECSNHAGGFATCPDCIVCNGQGGVTSPRDVDGDGLNEREIYVACGSGTDNGTCGDPGSPCNTINYALNTRAPSFSEQRIVCFRGTCSNEPSGGMAPGPDGSNVMYTRTKLGNEVRNFNYPKDPTMVIGWDFNNNGDYPPHDTSDTAVVNGAGKVGFISGTPNHTEFAHFTIRDYGRDDLGAAAGDQQVWNFSASSNGQPGNAYLHDLENINILRGNTFADQADILVALWNVKWSYLSMENSLCQDCGGYMFRGSSDDVTPGYGPFRFKNLTWRARGGTASGVSGAGAIGVKVWGPGNGWEWLDNIWDMNLANWTPGDYHYAYCMIMAQCTQDIDIINNEFLDCTVQGIQIHPDGGSSFCQSRPITNVNIAQNIFRNTRALPSNSCCANFVHLQGASTGGAPSSVYLNNVTIANNFFSSTLTGDSGYSAAILSAGGRNGSSDPGTFRIVNNTIHGTYQADRGCGCYRGSIVLDNEDSSQFPADNFVIMDNNVSGINGTAPSRAINVQTRPSNFQADDNVYNSQGTFIWNGGGEMNLATWRTNLGGCPGTNKDCNSLANCVPSYVNAASGDFHLNTSDTCARGHGADLLTMFSGLTLLDVDIDRDLRPSGAWDVGADQAGLLAPLAAPRLLEVVPLTP